MRVTLCGLWWTLERPEGRVPHWIVVIIVVVTVIAAVTVASRLGVSPVGLYPLVGTALLAAADRQPLPDQGSPRST